MPIAIENRLSELDELVKKYPIYIPADEVAAFLHMKGNALRASMEQGRCPFGIAWKLGERMAYKIPTVTFYVWFTKAALIAA